jgi:hypothetical protein
MLLIHRDRHLRETRVPREIGPRTVQLQIAMRRTDSERRLAPWTIPHDLVALDTPRNTARGHRARGWNKKQAYW